MTPARMAFGLCVAAAVFLLARSRFRSPAFVARHVPAATAEDLAWLRILAAGVLLGSALWEDLPRTALLPREFVQPMGVLTWVLHLPGARALAADAGALRAWQGLTIAALGCALVGWHTRAAAAVAAALYLVFGGLLRQYFAFNHAGLVPLYLLAFLAATPCGDTWSVDARRGRRSTAPAIDYTWARFTCWLAIAAVYVEAGLSKLRNGGWFWWDPENIRQIYLHPMLDPMQFSWQVGLRLAEAPAIVLGALGLGALLLELSYGTVPFFRRARRVLPPLMAAFHVAVLFLQNLLFLDLLVLQLAFWAPPRPDAGAPATRAVGPTVAAACLALLFGVWGARLEFYPFTAVQMFSWRKPSPVIEFHRLLATTAGGDVVARPLRRCLYGAAAQVMLLKRALDPARRAPVARFFDACAADYNATAAAGDRISRWEVQRLAWDVRDGLGALDTAPIVARWIHPGGD